MKILLVYASVCLAGTSAGLAGFGGSGGAQGGGGGYSNQASFNDGGYSSGFAGGSSTGMNLFGNGGGLGNLGFGGGGFSSGGFGASGGNQNLGSGLGNSASSGNSNGAQNQQGGQIRRFVSVHVAPPEESVSSEPRIIRAGGKPETHYNIVFIRAPSASSQRQTEVVLPEAPQQKTLVYVLVKRPDENQDNVKIRAPAPTRPSKPEVFFIRYKPESDQSAGNAGQGESGNISGLNGGGNNFGNNNGFGSSGSSYGPPSQQSGGGSNRGGSNGGYQ